MTAESIKRIVDDAPEHSRASASDEKYAGQATHDGPTAPATPAAAEGVKASQATVMVDLALAKKPKLFHTSRGDTFLTVKIDGRTETFPLVGEAAGRYLRYRYYTATGKAPHRQAVSDALGVLGARALFDGPEAEVHVRMAAHDRSLYLDLGDADRHIVRIDRDCWAVSTPAPVHFRRPRGLLPLPLPVEGGTIDELRPFLNVASSDDFRLLASALLSALFPSGPYPIVMLIGEQGTAKTTTARAWRALVDPNVAPLRAEPRDVRDLMIAATNGHVVGFDNVSRVRPWLSDALCRLATGGGFSTRQLYSDGDEILFEAERPVIANSIEEIAIRGDLADRSIQFTLPRISEDQRKTYRDFWRDFEEARPRILGALLDVLVRVIRDQDGVALAEMPRMADFAQKAAAAAPALGWTAGDFLSAYGSNRSKGRDASIDAEPLALAMIDFMADPREWTGTSTDLLELLNRRADDDTRKLWSWPKAANALTNRLRRIAPDLREHGIDVDLDRPPPGSRRGLTITSTPSDEGGNGPSGSSEPSATATPGSDADDQTDGLAPQRAGTPSADPTPAREGPDGPDGPDDLIPQSSHASRPAVADIAREAGDLGDDFAREMIECGGCGEPLPADREPQFCRACGWEPSNGGEEATWMD